MKVTLEGQCGKEAVRETTTESVALGPRGRDIKRTVPPTRNGESFLIQDLGSQRME